MPLTDAEIGKLFAEGRIAEWHAALEAQAVESAPRPQEAAVLSEARVMIMFKRFAANVAQVQVQREAALQKRIAELEKRLKAVEARAAAVSISAGDVSIDGMHDVASMLAKLDRTLRSPVKPVYGPSGLLIGARRVATLEDEASEQAARDAR